jgi:hypothetical protein
MMTPHLEEEAMVLTAVTCPYYQSDYITKRGKTDAGKQCYRCLNPNRPHQSFLINPAHKGRVVQDQRIDYRYGFEWQWPSGYGTDGGHQHRHSAQRT